MFARPSPSSRSRRSRRAGHWPGSGRSGSGRAAAVSATCGPPKPRRRPGSGGGWWSTDRGKSKYDRIHGCLQAGLTEDLTETELLAGLLVVRALRDKLLEDEARLIAAARRRLASAAEPVIWCSHNPYATDSICSGVRYSRHRLIP
ncbi:hypothetical protein [Streptomyces sp. NPDC058086]|uniref:hypothetical protein n=1 Tax=Streptomyces sp. NPDC058086 TaxID=3346334 RepID=UPI0036E5B30F